MDEGGSSTGGGASQRVRLPRNAKVKIEDTRQGAREDIGKVVSLQDGVDAGYYVIDGDHVKSFALAHDNHCRVGACGYDGGLTMCFNMRGTTAVSAEDASGNTDVECHPCGECLPKFIDKEGVINDDGVVFKKTGPYWRTQPLAGFKVNRFVMAEVLNSADKDGIVNTMKPDRQFQVFNPPDLRVQQIRYGYDEEEYGAGIEDLDEEWSQNNQTFGENPFSVATNSNTTPQRMNEFHALAGGGDAVLGLLAEAEVASDDEAAEKKFKAATAKLSMVSPTTTKTLAKYRLGATGPVHKRVKEVKKKTMAAFDYALQVVRTVKDMEGNDEAAGTSPSQALLKMAGLGDSDFTSPGENFHECSQIDGDDGSHIALSSLSDDGDEQEEEKEEERRAARTAEKMKQELRQVPKKTTAALPAPAPPETPKVHPGAMLGLMCDEDGVENVSGGGPSAEDRAAEVWAIRKACVKDPEASAKYTRDLMRRAAEQSGGIWNPRDDSDEEAKTFDKVVAEAPTIQSYKGGRCSSERQASLKHTPWCHPGSDTKMSQEIQREASAARLDEARMRTCVGDPEPCYWVVIGGSDGGGVVYNTWAQADVALFDRDSATVVDFDTAAAAFKYLQLQGAKLKGEVHVNRVYLIPAVEDMAEVDEFWLNTYSEEEFARDVSIDSTKMNSLLVSVSLKSNASDLKLEAARVRIEQLEAAKQRSEAGTYGSPRRANTHYRFTATDGHEPGKVVVAQVATPVRSPVAHTKLWAVVGGRDADGIIYTSEWRARQAYTGVSGKYCSHQKVKSVTAGGEVLASAGVDLLGREPVADKYYYYRVANRNAHGVEEGQHVTQASLDQAGVGVEYHTETEAALRLRVRSLELDQREERLRAQEVQVEQRARILALEAQVVQGSTAVEVPVAGRMTPGDSAKKATKSPEKLEAQDQISGGGKAVDDGNVAAHPPQILGEEKDGESQFQARENRLLNTLIEQMTALNVQGQKAKKKERRSGERGHRGRKRRDLRAKRREKEERAKRIVTELKARRAGRRSGSPSGDGDSSPSSSSSSGGDTDDSYRTSDSDSGRKGFGHKRELGRGRGEGSAHKLDNEDHELVKDADKFLGSQFCPNLIAIVNKRNHPTADAMQMKALLPDNATTNLRSDVMAFAVHPWRDKKVYGESTASMAAWKKFEADIHEVYNNEYEKMKENKDGKHPWRHGTDTPAARLPTADSLACTALTRYYNLLKEVFAYVKSKDERKKGINALQYLRKGLWRRMAEAEANCGFSVNAVIYRQIMLLQEFSDRQRNEFAELEAAGLLATGDSGGGGGGGSVNIGGLSDKDIIQLCARMTKMGHGQPSSPAVSGSSTGGAGGRANDCPFIDNFRSNPMDLSGKPYVNKDGFVYRGSICDYCEEKKRKNFHHHPLRCDQQHKGWDAMGGAPEMNGHTTWYTRGGGTANLGETGCL